MQVSFVVKLCSGDVAVVNCKQLITEHLTVAQPTAMNQITFHNTTYVNRHLH